MLSQQKYDLIALIDIAAMHMHFSITGHHIETSQTMETSRLRQCPKSQPKMQNACMVVPKTIPWVRHLRTSSQRYPDVLRLLHNVASQVIVDGVAVDPVPKGAGLLADLLLMLALTL
jgi:hypothetical protein